MDAVELSGPTSMRAQCGTTSQYFLLVSPSIGLPFASAAVLNAAQLTCFPPGQGVVQLLPVRYSSCSLSDTKVRPAPDLDYK